MRPDPPSATRPVPGAGPPTDLSGTRARGIYTFLGEGVRRGLTRGLCNGRQLSRNDLSFGPDERNDHPGTRKVAALRP
ncbi:hypothetical protein GCM10017687_57100 [Streptomyces echinatus]